MKKEQQIIAFLFGGVFVFGVAKLFTLHRAPRKLVGTPIRRLPPGFNLQSDIFNLVGLKPASNELVVFDFGCPACINWFANLPSEAQLQKRRFLLYPDLDNPKSVCYSAAFLQASAESRVEILRNAAKGLSCPTSVTKSMSQDALRRIKQSIGTSKALNVIATPTFFQINR